MKIDLSNNTSYEGVLCVKRDTMNDRWWVGVWANPDGSGYVGTEGECSRRYFHTADGAAGALGRLHGIDKKDIGIIRGYRWDERGDRVVQRAYKAQFGKEAPRAS